MKILKDPLTIVAVRVVKENKQKRLEVKLVDDGDWIARDELVCPIVMAKQLVDDLVAKKCKDAGDIIRLNNDFVNHYVSPLLHDTPMKFSVQSYLLKHARELSISQSYLDTLITQAVGRRDTFLCLFLETAFAVLGATTHDRMHSFKGNISAITNQPTSVVYIPNHDDVILDGTVMKGQDYVRHFSQLNRIKQIIKENTHA